MLKDTSKDEPLHMCLAHWAAEGTALSGDEMQTWKKMYLPRKHSLEVKIGVCRQKTLGRTRLRLFHGALWLVCP